MTSKWACVVVVTLIAIMALAQATAPASPEMTSPPDAVPSAPVSSVVTLKQGTAVRLKLGQRLSAKTSVVNSVVELVLDEDLTAGSVVVASKGARVIGRVTEGRKDCLNGPCGWKERHEAGKELSLQLEYVVTTYGKVKLQGEERGTSHRNKGAIVASTAAFGLTGLFVSMSVAKNTVLEENTPLVATVASDFDVVLPPGSQ